VKVNLMKCIGQISVLSAGENDTIRGYILRSVVNAGIQLSLILGSTTTNSMEADSKWFTKDLLLIFQH